MTAPAYRPCPDGAALNIRGEHFTCDAMRHMHESSATHDGWPHSNMDAEAIWTERAALVTALQTDKQPSASPSETKGGTVPDGPAHNLLSSWCLLALDDPDIPGTTAEENCEVCRPRT